MNEIEILKVESEKANINLLENQLNQFDKYKDLLIEWNEKMNLTAIIEPSEIMIKHFLDSILPLSMIDFPNNCTMIDIGTGAGFPSIPLKIARPDIKLTMLDSLNKRLTFLDEVCNQLQIKGATTVHSRAEDGGRNALYRDKFDIAIARAVASLPTLCEYCMPAVKVGGRFIAMKGPSGKEELQMAQNAIKLLGGELENTFYYNLPDGSERSIIVIKKVSPTAEKYPRIGGKIKKSPL